MVGAAWPATTRGPVSKKVQYRSASVDVKTRSSDQKYVSVEQQSRPPRVAFASATSPVVWAMPKVDLLGPPRWTTAGGREQCRQKRRLVA